MTPSRTPRRGLALTLAGASAGAVLAIAAPLAASAHVHVDPADAAAGSTTTLTFTFSHGCDDSPTTALVVDIPDAAAAVTPVADGGWTIERVLGGDGMPTQVTYTATTPVESGLKASVSMDVLFSEDAADTTVAFPVTQRCVEGETAWTEIAADGEDPHSLDSPAPVVAVGAVADDPAEHGHGDAAASGGDAHAEETSSDGGGDPVARGLAGAGLVAAVLALVVSLVRGRRRQG